MKGLRNWKEALGKWGAMTVIMLLCLLLARFVFACELHFRVGMAWDSLSPLFSGAWQDIFPAAFIGIIALVPFVLLYLWLPKLAKGLYTAVIILMVLATAMLNEYYCNMRMPLDHVIFVYSTGDMADIVKTSVSLSLSQVLWFMLTVLIPVLVLVLSRRWTINIYVTAALAVLSGVLLLSVSYRRIIREDKLYHNHEDFCLSANQMSYSYVKITDYLRDSRKRNTYGSVDNAAMMEAAKRYQALHSEFSFPDTEYPFYHRNTDEDVIGGFFNRTTDSLPPNFVFIIVESLGQHLTSVDKPRLSFTPFLDSLKSEGLYWKNCLSTSERTFGVLPSIFASAPYGNKGFGFYFDVMPEHRSLLTDMRKNGYTTEYFYGVVKPTERYDAFLQQNLVDYIFQPNMENVDSAKYAYLNENHRWGIDDRELFEYIEQYKNEHPATRPHNDIIMTITTHEPFLFDGIERYEQETRRILEHTNGVTPTLKKIVLDNVNMFACYVYMDECLREVFRYYSSLPEYENTVFVITGDHRTGQLPYNSLVKYNVPLLIWSPLLKGNKEMDAVTSHLCVTPTLNAYLSHNYDYQTSGFSHWIAPVVDTAAVFRNTLKQAFMLNNRDVSQYVSGDYFLSGSDLYELQEDLNLKLCFDNEVYERLRAELADFDMLSRYAVHGNKLLNARNDVYNVVVAESCTEEIKIVPDKEFTRLVLTSVKDDISFIDASVQFDVQASDTSLRLPHMIISMGDYYQRVSLVSVTGQTLNTGKKEHFHSSFVLPVTDDMKGSELNIYLWNNMKASAVCSDVRINIMGYDPTIKKE